MCRMAFKDVQNGDKRVHEPQKTHVIVSAPLYLKSSPHCLKTGICRDSIFSKIFYRNNYERILGEGILMEGR
nr:hypothetical protein [Clostridia bacterium]